jgi:hypothetical protein
MTARWLGWTTLFSAVLTLALSRLAHDLHGWLAVLAVLAALSTFVLPVAIGICFPEDNWQWAPILSMLIALFALLVIPETGAARQTGIGLVTRKDEFIFLLVWGGWMVLPLLALLYVGLAALGLRIGRKRLAEKNWSEDAAFREMFAGSRVAGSFDENRSAGDRS